jgi:hypothetical protein
MRRALRATSESFTLLTGDFASNGLRMLQRAFAFSPDFHSQEFVACEAEA